MLQFRRKIILILLLCAAFCPTVHATETDSTRARGPSGFSPAFRSIQLDGATYLLGSSGGASVDFDGFVPSLDESRTITLGVRFTPEWMAWGAPGDGGNYRMDYNVLLRTSIAGEVARCDLLLGYGWVGGSASSWGGNVFKGGADLRWKLFGNGAGLLFKVSSSRLTTFVGVGLFLGYDAN